MFTLMDVKRQDISIIVAISVSTTFCQMIFLFPNIESVLCLSLLYHGFDQCDVERDIQIIDVSQKKLKFTKTNNVSSNYHYYKKNSS